MKRKVMYISALLVMISLMLFILFNRTQNEQRFAGEEFIEEWLRNENGTLATYIQEGKLVDEDLVKGREALSETLGLWMEYAIEKKDAKLFEEAYDQLIHLFLDEKGFVYWKLTEDGEKEVWANALVDDLRIASALFQAAELWNRPVYKNTARSVSNYLVENNAYKGILTDFYDKKIRYKSRIITLSYVEPESLAVLETEQIMDNKMLNDMLLILENAEPQRVFFPKSYNVQTREYQFDDTINLIDQSLVAYYRAKRGYSTNTFHSFIKEQFDKHGVIYGQYNRHSEKPAVDYESPAIYGWLILYSLQVNDDALALQLFNEMNKFQLKEGQYKGGYSVYKEDTHIFDNLVPLIAERELYNRKLIK
ncbi:glycosyl hydrolase [Jeotgalibacillus proteolyticus]|uniref:Glycosyl hydrolase n=1 Tax=Jeotgalibacillus proteolyticus TaxID=2082395 RepID=A0A2S5G6T9_9BACL|nr:glycosyl hydrolase [Jeotgalibacillus proteolyticus]